MIKAPPSSKRYTPVIIDLDNKNHSHSLVIDLIGKNKRVMEIGTSTGYMSKILIDRGNTVIGVEIDSEAAEIAGQTCEMMINHDIENVDLDNYFQPSSFDVIVCADVLEHLKYPGKVLLKIKKYLKHDGYVVISLPNICHGDVLLTLMQSEFRYNTIGLLDETHLRFFGFKDIVRLFNNCGYSITDLRTTNVSVGSTELKVNKSEIPELLLKFVEKIPNASVYQYVFKAVPSENPPIELKPEIDIKTLFNGLMEEIVNSHISEKNAYIALVEGEMERLNSQINEKSAYIAFVENQVDKYKSRINDYDQKNSYFSDRITELEHRLSHSQSQIMAISEQILECHQKNLKLVDEVTDIQSSVLWHLVMAYHNGFVERLLPHDTRRRNYYDLGIKCCRVFIAEGFRSLWQKYNERRIEKKNSDLRSNR
jgi:2-polyprenyl-3-methyl-5-hydroxy-6-metoxy-1,4-benzoquinol methylase/uncharacterized coiled-coil protein SlyX